MTHPALVTRLRTGGITAEVSSDVVWVRPWLLSATGQDTFPPPSAAGPSTLRIEFERGRPPSPAGWTPVTRGAWANDDGSMLIESVGGSGFTQHWSWADQQLVVRSWWSPTAKESVAASALRSRFHALRAQVLLHYPVLWRAMVHGLAPLHVSALAMDGKVAVLAGPGGVGKSTLVANELAGGAVATCDNLATSDGRKVNGLREPLRLPREFGGVSAGRATHDRREHLWTRWVPTLEPSVVVVVRRGHGPRPVIRDLHRDAARRSLVAGTFCAGELRRFWPLAATLALANGTTVPVPPVESIADELVHRLPCLELTLGERPVSSLGESLWSSMAIAKELS